jgi:tRNA U34 5-methylaminomethyl-2-thiouridine-forming methyltransferase MnmC
LKIDYSTIEAFPLEMDLVEKLNYSERLKLKGEESNYLTTLHTMDWAEKKEVFPDFHFEKRNLKLEAIELPENAFDLVYFDAFNPDLQPELWTEEVFRKIYLAMKPKGILMTYSAKGKVKRALKAAGFILNALSGPIGKREITQAVKT